jgi:hypothetical protein
MIRGSLDFNAPTNDIKGGRCEREDFLMVKRQNPSWLCKLGFHKWRNYGESVVVTWQERTPWGRARDPAVSTRKVLRRFGTHSREVFTRRKCLRCGVDLKRRLVKNPDGSLSCVGWDSTSEFEFEKDEEPERKTTGHKMVR